MSTMSTEILGAELLGANPGPAVHLAVLGIVVVAALVIFGIVCLRNKREAAQAEMQSSRKEDTWNYALLVYISAESLKGLSTEEARSLHGGHEAAASASATLIAHYRFRPPRTGTTIRLDGDQIVKTEGPSAISSEGLRGFYLLESDDPDAVLDFASQHPAVRVGGTAEVWPLIEPVRHAEGRPGHSGWVERH